MAFNIRRFTRVSLSDNTGATSVVLNPDTTSITVNGPAFFTYASADDTIATISAANYFNSEAAIYGLKIGDVILTVGTDASTMLQVATVSLTASPKTITVVSFTAVGVVGTADITNLAVTTGKIADNAVTSGKLSALALQYVAVPIAAAAFNAMYVTPIQLVAAGGANTLIVVDKIELLMTYGSAAYASGGVAHAQYANTTFGAGVIATTTLAAAAFQPTVSTGFVFNGGVVAQTFSTCVNLGLFLSNITGAFTTGNSAMVAHVWFKIIPTV